MFSSELINDPFGDPGVYVEFRYRNQAALFDLGDLYSMPPRKLLKISHIFVSHTHMDHFIGFRPSAQDIVRARQIPFTLRPAGFC
jgi:hypothetical protein